MLDNREVEIDSFNDAVSYDDYTLISSQALKDAIENPSAKRRQILSSDIKSNAGDQSLFYYAVSNKSFRFSDYILLQEDGQFRPGRNPCFAGLFFNERNSRSILRMSSLSTQQMFYVAQVIYRYHSEHDPASGMLDDLNSHRKTYFEAIYWTRSHGEKFYLDVNSGTNRQLFEKSADAIKYWDMAKRVTDLERAIAANDFHGKEKQHILIEVGDIYFALAFEEKEMPDPHYWYLNKAIESYAKALATARLAGLSKYLGISVLYAKEEAVREAILVKHGATTPKEKDDFVEAFLNTTFIESSEASISQNKHETDTLRYSPDTPTATIRLREEVEGHKLSGAENADGADPLSSVEQSSSVVNPLYQMVASLFYSGGETTQKPLYVDEEKKSSDVSTPYALPSDSKLKSS